MVSVNRLETMIADIFRDVGALSPSETVALLAPVTIVMLGLVETAWIASRRPARDRPKLVGDAATAGVMGIGGLIVGTALAGLFAIEFELIRSVTPKPVTGFWADHVWLNWATAFVAWDLAGHLYHRVGHLTAIGWAAHRPHHTGDEFGLSLAWRQSWLPVHAVVLPLVAIGGWSLPTIAVCAAVSNVIQAAQHSASRLRYPGWLRAICVTPVQHRRHHAVLGHGLANGESERTASAVNLGPVFTIWDRLAGTYVAAPVDPNAAYGVGAAGASALQLQLEGWTDLARRGSARRSESRAGRCNAAT